LRHSPIFSFKAAVNKAMAMNPDLVQAIDAAMCFVRAHPEQMTRAELEECSCLADQVYMLVVRAGLVSCLPQVPELVPQLDGSVQTIGPEGMAVDMHLPPVQFETKLNLPGDWQTVPTDDDDDLLPIPSWQDADNLPPARERVFMVCASPRWFHDMAVLWELASRGTPANGFPLGAFASASDLARHLGRPVPAVESFLRRSRDNHPDCYVETEGRRRNEPRYLYRVADILPSLQEHFARPAE
jgi:hypothetical protein